MAVEVVEAHSLTKLLVTFTVKNQKWSEKGESL